MDKPCWVAGWRNPHSLSGLETRCMLRQQALSGPGADMSSGHCLPLSQCALVWIFPLLVIKGGKQIKLGRLLMEPHVWGEVGFHRLCAWLWHEAPSRTSLKKLLGIDGLGSQHQLSRVVKRRRGRGVWGWAESEVGWREGERVRQGCSKGEMSVRWRRGGVKMGWRQDEGNNEGELRVVWRRGWGEAKMSVRWGDGWLRMAVRGGRNVPCVPPTPNPSFCLLEQ